MKNLLFCWLFLLSTSLGAQDLVSYIPSDVTFLLTWNAEQVNAKVNTRQLMQQESVALLFQEMVRGMDSLQQAEYHTLMTDPEVCGIQANKAFHFFGRRGGDGNYFAFLMPVSNPILLKKFLIREATLSGEEVPIIQENGFQVAGKGGYYLGWNANVAMIAGFKPTQPDFYFPDWEEAPEYDWEEEYEEEEPLEPVDEPEIWQEVPYDEPIGEVIEEENGDEGPSGELLLWMEEILNRTFPASLRGDTDYQTAVARLSDAHVWLDYGQFLQIDNPMTGGMGMGMDAFSSVNDLMRQLYEGVHLSVALNFNQGELDIQTQMVGKGRMMQVMQEAYKTRLNRKMLRYIDGQNLLGYYAVRLEVEELAEGIKDILMEAMASDPVYGESFARMMDVVDVVVDEEALYDLFKGDVFMGVTGVRRVEVPVTTYEYDLDFNASEVEKVVVKQVPEVLLMTSFGNRENMMKLIRLGESFNWLIPMGSYYLIPGSDESEYFYLALEKGVLLFTNDLELVESGWGAHERLAKNHRKALRRNVQSMFWDVRSTWAVLQENQGPDADPEALEVMEGLQEYLTSITLSTSKKVKPAIRSQVSIALADQESNALEQLLSLLNILVLESFGLERI